jgi:hypothetical protein
MGVHGQEEVLKYSLNWPSGLSLGDATLTSKLSNGGGTMTFSLEALVPGFPVKDTFTSKTAAGFCSVSFIKELQHGKRKTSETVTFDESRKVVVRQTAGGGKSEAEAAGPCPKDALAGLFFVRSELAKGRVAGSQTVYFGAGYQLRLQLVRVETVTVAEERVETERIAATIKGPASEHSFEVYFARDEARTPVLVRVPLSVGHMALELVR